MATIQSISKFVEDGVVTDDTQRALPATELEIIKEGKQSPVNGRASKSGPASEPAPVSESTSVSGQVPETVKESQTAGTVVEKQSTAKYKRARTGKTISVDATTKPKQPILKRNAFSDPGLANRDNDVTFDNLGFEPDVDPFSMRFSDVVSMLIRDQIQEDTHPYGRGNLYQPALDGGRRTTVYHDDGKLAMWFVVALFILGIALAAIVMSSCITTKVKLVMWFVFALFILGIASTAIVMSIMYQPEPQSYEDTLNTTTQTM